METQATQRPAQLRLTVVMPVFNEEATAYRVAQSVLDSPLVHELIAVDDGSTDGSAAELARAVVKFGARLRLLRHDRNRGKGASLRTAFAAVRDGIVLVQDADLEYDPDEYPKLIAPIVEGRADVVLGTRFMGAGSHRVLYFWHSMANRFLSLLAGMVADLNLTDMECGFKAFRADVLDRVRLREDRFGIEPELVCKIARLRPRIFEVPVSYAGRTYAEGKKITWRDGVSALRCILIYGLLGSD